MEYVFLPLDLCVLLHLQNNSSIYVHVKLNTLMLNPII